MASGEAGLRARKKAATSLALQRAAFDLFQSKGFDSTTVQDITAAAGVSQRTFFRYFPTKDAVLVVEHQRRENELREFLRQRPRESAHDLANAVVALLAADLRSRRDLVAAQVKLYGADPGLADRFSGHLDRLTVILAAHVATRLGVAGTPDPRPLLLAQQVIRSWTTGVSLWIHSDMTADLGALATSALDTARRDPVLIDPTELTPGTATSL